MDNSEPPVTYPPGNTIYPREESVLLNVLHLRVLSAYMYHIER